MFDLILIQQPLQYIAHDYGRELLHLLSAFFPL